MDKLRLIYPNIDMQTIIDLQNKSNVFMLDYKNLSTPPPKDIETTIGTIPNKFKLYLNDDLFQITVSYQPKTTSHTFTLVFNPNKVYRFINDIGTEPTDTLTNIELFSTFDFIQDNLIELGLPYKLIDMRMKEYHYCLDIPTNKTYLEYYPTLSMLAPPPKTRQIKSNYERTLYYRSKSSETIIYDKQKEWNEKNPNNPIDYNLIRFEYKKKLKSSIKFTDIDFTQLSKTSYNELINLFEIEILNDDILSYIITSINTAGTTINKIVTKLGKQVFLLFLKEKLNDNQLTLDDLLYKGLNRTEQAFKSKFKRELNNINILDDNLTLLFNEIKDKINIKGNSRANAEPKKYINYLGKQTQ